MLGLLAPLRNSLRALWALRSNKRSKSDDEARQGAPAKTPARLDCAEAPPQPPALAFAEPVVHRAGC